MNVHVQMKGWKAVYALRGRGHYDSASCRGKGEFTSCSEMSDFPCLAYVDFLLCFLRLSLFFLVSFPFFPMDLRVKLRKDCRTKTRRVR